MEKVIPIEVSARHIHLSRKDLEALFGKGYQLTPLRKLSQPGGFAAKEDLDIQINSKKISRVKIVGPLRKETQIELAETDAILLRVNAPIRKSGDLKGTPGAILIGPKKKIKIKQGVINTWRHIHCNPGEAKELGLKDGMLVSVKTRGRGSVTFHNVIVQISKNSWLCMHLDTDEGNAARITKRGEGMIVKT